MPPGRQALKEDPPFLLDAARVVEFAAIDPGMDPSGQAHAVVGGVTLDLETIRGVVIVESLLDGAIFLLHCGKEWETVAASPHADVEAARASAAHSYSGFPIPWRAYRPLTAEERKEIETTSAFLREITAEDQPPTA